MSDAHASESLDFLLRTAHDSVESFRQGAELARNPAFQSLFRDRAKDRQRLLETIQAEARAFGVVAADKGTMIGEANRLITPALNALSRNSDKGLVEELVRREHIVARNLAEVAGDEAAPKAARQIAASALTALAQEEAELEGLSEQLHH